MKDVTKKKLGQIAKAMRDTQAAFRFQVDLLAEEARNEILPYFKKHDLEFTTGNGTWAISKPGASYNTPELFVRDEDLPANIRDLLCLETEHNRPLGFYIRDIKRGEWK